MDSQERQDFEKLSQHKKTWRHDPESEEIMEALMEILASTQYSDKAHFIYELLQNADDAKATKVNFILEEDRLIFKHNGKKHFSISNYETEKEDKKKGKLGAINAITSIGKSTKLEEHTIGKFGIGFKAVFAYTSTPHIYDPKFRFKIEEEIIPYLLDEDHPMRRSKETLFDFPFDRLEKPKEEAYEEISHKLQNLSFPLLFLPNLKRIDFKFQDISGFYDKKIKEERQFDETIAEQICLTQNDDFVNLWLFSRENENNHKYSVGYFLDDEGKLRPINKPAFCFFQTKESTWLNFIIHAPFKLTSSRESIPAGEPHNDTMLQSLANLSADALVYLRDIGQEKNIRLIDDDIFNIIPINEKNFSDHSDKNQVSFLPFFEAIKKKFETDRLLPASDGYVSKKNAYWASAKNIPDVFSNEQLGDLVKDKDAKWVFVSRGYDEKRNYFVEDRRCINDYWMINHIQGGFIEEQSFEWLHEFYAWISESKYRISCSKSKPFFLDQNGNAVAAYDSSNHPILFLPSADNKSGYKFIHPELLDNTMTCEFFKNNIGLTEPDLKDHIYNIIRPSYKNGTSVEFDTAQHFENFKHCLEYYGQCPNNDIDTFINDIKDWEFLIYDTYEHEEPKQAPGKASSMYMPIDTLKAYFETKKDTRFIALDDYKKLLGASEEERLRKFLLKLGVKNKIAIINVDIDRSTEGLPSPYIYSWEVKSYCYKENIIDGCKEILNHIIHNNDEDKSYILWNSLLDVIKTHCSTWSDLDSKLTGTMTVIPRSAEHQYPYTSTYANKLKTLKWLVNSEGEFVSAKDVTTSTLSEKYKDKSSDVAKSLLKFLKIADDEPIKETEENTSLPESVADKDAAWGKKVREAGIENENDLNEFQEFKRWKEAKNQANRKEAHEYNRYQANMKASRIDDESDAWYDIDDDVPIFGTEQSNNRTSSVVKDIVQRTKTLSEQTPLEPPTDDDQDIDHDEYTPPSIDYSRRIERAKQRVGYTIKKLSVLENLQAEATNATKYSYGWFKALLELECLSHDETNANSKAVSISFAKVEREPGTERILVLKHPNRYIPMFMEDLADIPLVLHMEDQTKTIAIEVANIKSYTLRVKLKNNADIEGIDLCSVTSATIDAKSPAFLLQELRKGFHELGFEDDYDMKDNLCKNIEFVFGPPGTGKTTHLAQKVLIPMMQNNADCKVLVLTPTNKSADVLVRRIMEVSQDESYNNWLVRFGATGDETIEQSPVFRDKTFDIRTLSKNITVTTIARFPYDFFMPQGTRIFIHAIHWDYIVIDEASMIPIANIVFPLYKTTPREFIIAGDPFQIEPITSVNLWKDENIYTMVKLNSFTHPKTEPYPYKVELLTTQYRSIPDIGEIFSKFAYGGILQHYRTAKSQRSLNLGDGLGIKTLNIIKFPVSKYESIYRSKQLAHSSSYQIYSALFTFEYVCYLSKAIASSHPNGLFKIGVIAPYRAQADMIDKLLASENLPKEVDVQVGTIHGFQGDECDIIFAVFNTPPTISDWPEMFLNKRNIINVSISRARDYLFLVMPDDQTENITNLRLVKGVEQLMHNTQACHEQLSPSLEEWMFDDPKYLENNAFSTSHQSVNVYGLPEKRYEVRTEDTAVDIQIHKAFSTKHKK